MVGLEHIPQLCQLSTQNLRKSPVHAKMLDQDKTISIVKGDGRLGYPEGGMLPTTTRCGREGTDRIPQDRTMRST